MDSRGAPAPSTVTCTLTFDVTAPADIVVQVAAARSATGRVDETLTVTADRPDGAQPVPEEMPGPVGGRQHLVHAPVGRLAVHYRAAVSYGPAEPARVTPAERVEALRPSRYCPSDRLLTFAQRVCGEATAPAEKVRAICDDVFERVAYLSGTSGPTTDAIDTLLTGQGVCRDFAHAVAALCRAAGVPARIAAVYAPGLTPMDLHAVVETELDGVWQVWDATRLAPRPALIRIATGRDAADNAFASVLSGFADLSTIEITAVAGGGIPLDDHQGFAALR